jgi:hypothetical protein
LGFSPWPPGKIAGLGIYAMASLENLRIPITPDTPSLLLCAGNQLEYDAAHPDGFGWSAFVLEVLLAIRWELEKINRRVKENHV